MAEAKAEKAVDPHLNHGCAPCSHPGSDPGSKPGSCLDSDHDFSAASGDVQFSDSDLIMNPNSKK